MFPIKVNDTMERWQFPLLLNLNPFRNEISKGVSVFTAVKNRKETLIESLKTWVAHDQIDEIIIVDWSSDDSLIPYIQQFQNGKILLAIIRNQPKWILSHAYNLAARLTTKSKILKMDADVKILPGFFQQHNLESGIFFTGNWESARDENDKHLNGICYMFRDDFFSVNGYNEFIKSYGWDDIDLYDRLKAKSLIRKDLTHNTLLHIPHANRTNFQSQMSFLNTANDMEKSLLNSLVNKFISSSYKKWSLEENPLSFSIKFQDQFTIFCDQEGEDNNIVPPDIISQCESMAIIERFYELGAGLSRELLSELNREELITLLNLHYTRQHLSESGSLFDIIYKINRKYLVANDDKDIEINKLKDENCLKEELLDTRKQIIKHKNLLINSLNFRLDEYKNSLVRSQNKIIALKSSYSWKTGHAMMSGIAFTQSLLKNLGTNVQIFRNKTSEIKEKSLSTSDNHDFLTQKQYLPKVNLGDQVGAYYGTHRSGWRFAVSALAELHKPDGVFLDTFIERTFIWHPDGIRPHQKPWIGFIHVPPFVPTWHDYTVSNDSIFTIPEWIKSFKYCRGLYTLSRYHKRLLESQLHNIPINSLFHPTEEPIVKWKWDHFQRNSEKKVIQVGSWLRK
ncbi:MAG: glycosyltransferase family 2 protein, partial [Bacteroidales bacterium]|nr:glycosyltransferase family 2 protein [Bacteroidales bacterium]